MRVCVSESQTPASLNVGARLIAEDAETTVAVGHCGEIMGAHITVKPAGALGGQRRVKGVYRIVS